MNDIYHKNHIIFIFFNGPRAASLKTVSRHNKLERLRESALIISCDSCFQVLQKQMDLELELFGDLKDKTSVGKVYMLSLSSQPVDHEDASGERQKVRFFENGERSESSKWVSNPLNPHISGPPCSISKIFCMFCP